MMRWLWLLLVLLVACGSGDQTSGADASTDGALLDGSTGDGPASSDAADGAPQTPAGCAAWPAPNGKVIAIKPSDAANLTTIFASAQSGDTLSFADGTYATGGAILKLATPNVTVRSASGNRDAVIIDGGYKGSEIFAVTASNVTLADVTITRAPTHPIHVQATMTDVLGVTIYNVHIKDPGQQGIKINSNGAWTDKGTIACSLIELTSAGRPQVMNNCYTGGIDGHQSDGWSVHDNVIQGFWCPQGLSEHGIHFWTGSRGTRIERNRVRDCARGIGLGLQPGSSSDKARTYQDTPPCASVSGTVEHYQGVVRNNFISAEDPALFASSAGFDNGIEIDAACDAKIIHNTVASTSPPLSSSSEWRFGSNPLLLNNLTSAQLKDRDGAGRATQTGNVAGAQGAWFVNLAGGDLHLTAAATSAIKKGAPLMAGQCDDDIDGKMRALASPSVGAHEY